MKGNAASLVHPAGQRQEETEMIREGRIVAGDRSPVSKSSASNVSPSVARTYFAFALVVAGLAFSRASVSPTDPGAAAAMWMLLV